MIQLEPNWKIQKELVSDQAQTGLSAHWHPSLTVSCGASNQLDQNGLDSGFASYSIPGPAGLPSRVITGLKSTPGPWVTAEVPFNGTFT